MASQQELTQRLAEQLLAKTQEFADQELAGSDLPVAMQVVILGSLRAAASLTVIAARSASEIGSGTARSTANRIRLEGQTDEERKTYANDVERLFRRLLEGIEQERLFK